MLLKCILVLISMSCKKSDISYSMYSYLLIQPTVIEAYDVEKYYFEDIVVIEGQPATFDCNKFRCDRNIGNIVVTINCGHKSGIWSNLHDDNDMKIFDKRNKTLILKNTSYCHDRLTYQCKLSTCDTLNNYTLRVTQGN